MVGLLAWLPLAGAGEMLRVAAAADLRYALDEIADQFRKSHPEVTLEVIYGSSGKLTTQMINGAPFDVFFSADIQYPQTLQAAGLTATEPEVYALGRIVLWSTRHDAATMTLADLTRPDIRRIAIAQPAHAPYGMRAKEALEASGVWAAVAPKLVFGENIAQAAQMAASGAVDVGIIALSLALFPAMAEHGYALIDDTLHVPLTQGFVVTRRAAANPAAMALAAFMHTPETRTIMERYGFVMP